MSGREYVEVAEVAPGVTTVTIDRPPVHPVNFTMMRELKDAFDSLHPGNGVTVITATGRRAFSAGADLRERLPKQDTAARTRFWRTLLATIRAFPSPVIAAVNGVCLGSGIGIITQCDLRFAIETATFGLPEIKVGRAGGAAHLRRLVHEGTVRRLMLTGETLTASEALQAGLVDEVFPASSWPDEALARASDIGIRGAPFLIAVKKVLDLSERGSLVGSPRKRSDTIEVEAADGPS